VAITLSALKDEYQLLYDSCLIRPDRLSAADAIASKIGANRARYQRVGDPLGIPWYVIGVIHSLEVSLSFSGHLHNGDPLSARTVRWPPGRPKTGNPPFTWEESARDALTGQGLHEWTDWSVAGTLYKLEAYNGFGYRMIRRPIPSPYLWSFSNHYARGKFVADGKFSDAAVSGQCGAVVLLKRLAEQGRIAVKPSVPRTLQLSNPRMTGSDVEEAQRLLRSNPFGDFAPGTPDGDFGPVTADAVERAKWALGYALGQVNGTFGPLLRKYLDGSKELPAGYLKRREQRLKEAPDEAKIRTRIVKWALWGVKNSARIAHSRGANRLAALETPGKMPLATDCSAFATLCYAWAKAPNPNHRGPYDPEAGGYTGTMLERCSRIPRTAAKPGDLVVWTPPGEGSHVAVIVSTGSNPWVVSHGSDNGPKRVRLADEDAAQRRDGHGTPVFLTAF
jgi:lysozyme family protein